MSEQRLRDLLRITPDEGELEARASRARRLALGRLNEHRLDAPDTPWWRWKSAVALAALCAFSVFVITREPEATPAPESLRVHVVLSDGTRVQWILHDDFKL